MDKPPVPPGKDVAYRLRTTDYRLTMRLQSMRNTTFVVCSVFHFALISISATAAEAAPARKSLPANLACGARITASSEYSQNYLCKFVADGKVPSQEGHDDLNQAWCVPGDKARGGQLDFEWAQPVEIQELIYFGRTGWFVSECFKDYEVYVNDAKDPSVRGSFAMVHGPQRIALQASGVQRLSIKFLNSYDGPNPGASELLIYAKSVSPKELAAVERSLSPAMAGSDLPFVDCVDCDKLRSLIRDLAAQHGSRYAESGHHLNRLEELQKAAKEAGENSDKAAEVAEQLAALQRSVLLFDMDRAIAIRRYEITASHVYTYHYEGFRAGGGIYNVSLRNPQEPPIELASSPTGQILDCDLSFDGRTVVFSWRQSENEGYHLWTVDVDGKNLKQITRGEWHDYNACWLPDGDIAFLTTASPQFAYCWHAPVGVLHRMHPDGSGIRKLSANYLNDFTPQVLEDGRLIYTRWEYVDRPAIPIQSLWTINPDGTGLAGYFGNRVISPGTFMEARPIPGTGKIICTMTGHNGPTRGAIGIVDRTRGDNAQASIENITPDVPVPAVDQGNGNTEGTKLYSCPMPLDATRFLVSARGPELVRTLRGDCQSTALEAPAQGMQWFSVTPIRVRQRPPVVPGREHVGDEPFATLYLQDVYDGLEPQVKRGEIVMLRVVRDIQKSVRIDPSLRAFGFQFPVISCGATYAAKDVIGEVPVEPDGSAYFRVPSGKNVSFMAIDSQGRAVQRMRSFTHLMDGEVQGCIGCHEHRGKTPDRRQTMALRQPPRDVQPPEWGAGGFDYSRVVQPVLDRYCVECHNSIDAPKGLDLTGGKTDFFNVSYDTLARENQGQRGSPYVNWIPTYNGQEWNILEITPKAWGSSQSRLAEVLFSGHPDQDGKRRLNMDPASIRRVIAWIDLNVPYYGTSETAYPERIGCRQLYPDSLDKVLADVASRRCSQCHADGKFPRREWTRITEPELNPFLLAPLARECGGSQKCGRPVFTSKEDPDYRAILSTFEPIVEMLKTRPRMDMPGGMPAPDVCRASR